MKLKIKYYKNKCISNYNCIKYAKKYFQKDLKDNKLRVKLINSNKKSSYYLLEGDFAKKDFNMLIKAAKMCPINAIEILDENNNLLVSKNIDLSKTKTIIAKQNKNLILDQKGYFLIRVNKKNKTIEVGFCKEKNIVLYKFIGKKPEDLYKLICKRKLISRLDHAAYLGNELQKAYLALKLNKNYVQDDDLL